MFARAFVPVILIALAAPMAATAQARQRRAPDDAPRTQEAQRAPEPARVAVPRAEPQPAQPAETREAQRAAPQARTAAAAEEQRRAVPREGRPRGDNPGTGVAVPRSQSRPPQSDGRRVYVAPRSYGSYYYYPRRYYPYGYGAFGLGYFYYDPYVWYPYGGSWGHPGYAYGPNPAYYDTGEVRLRVTPRSAEVYVEGYFAGYVDDFDGTFQALRLESGPHQIRIVAPGYEPLDFDVRITPGRKITYRGELRRP